MAKYEIDINKLWEAIDGKRRMGGHSWRRLEAKMGVGASTFHKMRRTSNKGLTQTISANTLASCLVYLKRPITDFIIENEGEVYKTNGRNTRNQGICPPGTESRMAS